MRAAIFFVPPADDPLTLAAAAWLTRDPFGGAASAPVPGLVIPAEELPQLVAEPRRYGFHATLKAPFRLADGVELSDLGHAVEAFAAARAPWVIPALQIERLGPFFALTQREPDPRLQQLAAEVVRDFDRFRAPLSTAEIARRNPERLTATERTNLKRWGYPHVFDEFQFHMTLTGPVPADRRADVAAVLAHRFAPLLAAPVAIDALAMFVEPEAGADFRVEARYPFTGASAR